MLLSIHSRTNQYVECVRTRMIYVPVNLFYSRQMKCMSYTYIAFICVIFFLSFFLSASFFIVIFVLMYACAVFCSSLLCFIELNVAYIFPSIQLFFVVMHISTSSDKPKFKAEEYELYLYMSRVGAHIESILDAILFCSPYMCEMAKWVNHMKNGREAFAYGYVFVHKTKNQGQRISCTNGALSI